jgi:hypothetical protein
MYKIYTYICKGKVFPLQAWTGPWRSGRLRRPDFSWLSALWRWLGGKVVTLTHRPSLLPGVSWYSFLEAEPIPGHMVASVASEKIPSNTTGDRSWDPPTNSAVPNHFATPGPICTYVHDKITQLFRQLDVQHFVICTFAASRKAHNKSYGPLPLPPRWIPLTCGFLAVHQNPEFSQNKTAIALPAIISLKRTLKQTQKHRLTHTQHSSPTSRTVVLYLPLHASAADCRRLQWATNVKTCTASNVNIKMYNNVIP